MYSGRLKYERNVLDRSRWDFYDSIIYRFVGSLLQLFRRILELLFFSGEFLLNMLIFKNVSISFWGSTFIESASWWSWIIGTEFVSLSHTVHLLIGCASALTQAQLFRAQVLFVIIFLGFHVLAQTFHVIYALTTLCVSFIHKRCRKLYSFCSLFTAPSSFLAISSQKSARRKFRVTLLFFFLESLPLTAHKFTSHKEREFLAYFGLGASDHMGPSFKNEEYDYTRSLF